MFRDSRESPSTFKAKLSLSLSLSHSLILSLSLFIIHSSLAGSFKSKNYQLKLFEGTAIGQQLSGQSPHLFSRVLQTARRLPFEQIQIGQEIVRASSTLEAGYQLQENSVNTIRYTTLVPLGLQRVLLAFVEQQRLHVIAGHRISGKIEVSVPQGLENAEASPAAATLQQSRLRFRERENPRVTLHSRLLPLKGHAFLRQQIETLGLNLGDEVRMRPRYVRDRPMGSRSRPNPRTFERRRDLDHVSLPDP